MKETLRRYICIPAYIIVALCALICSIQHFTKSDKITMKLIHFNSDNETVKTISYSVLLIASIVTLGCAIGWMIR